MTSSRLVFLSLRSKPPADLLLGWQLSAPATRCSTR